MCIICTRNFTVETTEIVACNKVKNIPKKLTCKNTDIKEIPKELVNLECLKCGDTSIKELPNTLTKLTYLSCKNIEITEIPKELISLVEIRVNNMIIKVPKELINIKGIRASGCGIINWDSSWMKTKDEIKKNIKLQRYIKLYLKLPNLWKLLNIIQKRNFHQVFMMNMILKKIFKNYLYFSNIQS